ncbi:glycosyltransferase family 2 protein [Nonomuraea rhodomycinica]|uniref:Glycosyltransferase n=1 Tax=Nonomuraea rhodomycinica TaxID=1712872 RepID=A0A7Y6M9R8_9ACTN|nr:glycosyltransferase [Nonomuraea rhodomycinica]NUW38689.1 glycosyltransferase [Nonomuraea rhodomycinica]
MVTAVYGNVHDLDGLLEALREQRPSGALDELVIVDNHRQRRLPDDFRADSIPGCAIRVVHEPHVGLSRARNAGIRAASGAYVLVTDPDSRPLPNWVHELSAALRESGAFCAGGRTVADLPAADSPRAELPAAVLEQFVPLAWPEHRTRLRAPYWLIGCNLGFRNEPESLFDETLGVRGERHLSCEDLEFVIRALCAGEEVIVAPKAVVRRAVRSADLRTRSVLLRAFWHGVSVARVRRLHGGTHIYDSYRIRDALRAAANRVVLLMNLARIAGFRIERLRLHVCRRLM